MTRTPCSQTSIAAAHTKKFPPTKNYFSLFQHMYASLDDCLYNITIVSRVTLKHNLLFWPTWVLTQDIISMRLYRSCYIDPLKCTTWAHIREWALAWALQYYRQLLKDLHNVSIQIIYTYYSTAHSQLDKHVHATCEWHGEHVHDKYATVHGVLRSCVHYTHAQPLLLNQPAGELVRARCMHTRTCMCEIYSK